jgi:cobalt-zinc-cadmium efflux system outer membrane protein
MAEAPSLEASEAGVESSEWLVEQAGRWINPSISMEAENFGGTGGFGGNDSAEYTVLLEQPIELGGKRKARRSLADVDLNESSLLATIARQELEGEVRRRFIQALRARDQLKQALGLEQAARSAAEAVEVQKGLGAAAGLDERRTRVSLALAQIEVDGARRDYDEARELLASLWNGTGTFEVTGELQVPDNLPDDRVFESLLRNSVRWQLAELSSERQRQVLEMERSTVWPDLTLGVGYRWFEEDDAEAWVAGLSFSLPIFDRNLGRVEAAASGVRKTNAEVELKMRELRESMRRTVSSLRRAHEMATRLRAEALPLARETYELVAEGYSLGRYELLYLLESQKTLSEVERHWLTVLSEFQTAVSDLQSLVGEIPASLEL